MNIRLLCYVDPDLGPEARWFLLQWSRVMGFEQTVTCPLRELYSSLGMSAQRAKPALEMLKARSYISCKSHSCGRGRPLSSHQVSPKFCHSLRKVNAPATAHQPEIESLCHQAITLKACRIQNPQNLMSGEKRANTLSPATYLLLAVLLVHAEAPGIVRGLSYGRLRAVTGMSKERLKSQLSKLKKLGVIAQHEPGALRRRDGVSMRSVFFLDLAHPLLLGKDSIGLSVVFSSGSAVGQENFLSGFYKAALVASKLIKSFEIIREKVQLRGRYAKAYTELLPDARFLLPPLKYLEPVVDDFLVIDRLGIGPTLKAHVQSYALMLLSNHWEDLLHERGKPFSPVGPVMAAIQADCSSITPEENAVAENGLFTFIYALAHHIACELQNALLLIERNQGDCDFAAAAFSMMPFYQQGLEFWRLNVHIRPSDGVTYLQDAFFNFHSVSLILPDDLDVLATQVPT